MKKYRKSKQVDIKQDDDFFFSQAELDYHVNESLNIYEIEKMLNEFLEDCFISQYNQIVVITGTGKVVKPMVYRLLKRNEFVKSFKIASQKNGGQGAYEVILKN